MTAFFVEVLEASCSVSVLILLLLALSPLVNKRYAAKWKYGIWILLALRLIFPVSMPKRQIVLAVPEQLVTVPVSTVPETIVQQGMPSLPQKAAVAPMDILAWVWLIGCVLFLAAHLISYWRYRRNILRRGTRVTDLGILQQIRSISGELGIRRRIPVIQDGSVASPMVLGFFRPILVTPEIGLPVMEQYFVLKHELVHLKRYDVFSKFLFVLANAVHWFNPLVYLLRQEAVVDMELSCDERVVKDSVYETRKAYTETLLNTLTRQYRKPTALSTQFYGGKEIMKKRFRNILSRVGKRNGVAFFLMAALVVLVLGTSIRLAAMDPTDTDSVGDDIFDAGRAFALAFQRGDREAMEAWLDRAYDGPGEVHPEADPNLDRGSFNGMEHAPRFGDISNNSLFWPSTWDKDVPLGSTYTVVMRQDNWVGDHILVSLVNREEGWKVRDYRFVRGEPVPQEPTPEKHWMMEAAMAFGEAYADGNRAAMKACLEDPAMEGLSVYEGSKIPGQPLFRTAVMAPQPGDIAIDDRKNVSIMHESVPMGSTFTVKLLAGPTKEADYLLVQLRKQQEGWKVISYAYNGQLTLAAEAETRPAGSDGQQMEQLAQAFFDAYIEGDSKALRSCLSGDQAGGVKTFAGELVRVLGIYGIPEGEEHFTPGSTNTLWVSFLESRYPDEDMNLGMELIKEETGWKVRSYWLEP